PVLLTAAYTGKVMGGVADFEARYEVWCPAEEAASLALPLDGVQLQEDVFLDGARAYPVTQRPPLVGYTVRVKGRGSHSLSVRFTVPVQITDDNCDLQFTVPRVAQSRLTLTAEGASHLSALVKQGAQRVQAGEKEARIEVDLGRVNSPLHFQWRQGPAGKP